MMIFADLAVIAIIAVSVFIGMKRGLLRSVVGFFSILISIAIAAWAYPVVADVINNTGLDETITSAIEERMGGESTADEPEADSEAADSRGGGFSVLPKSAQNALEEQTDAFVDSARRTTAQTISSLAVNIISMLAVFIIVRLIMFFISLALKFVTKLPIIGGLDKGLGALLGGLCGVLIVFLLLTLLTFNTALNSNHAIGKAVKESYIASYMYDNNFIVSWISGN